MRRIGFIDIEDGLNVIEEQPVHLFNEHAKRFEFEKTVTLQSADAVDFFLSVPLSLMNFRVLRFPFSDREKLKKVIPFELDNLIIGGSDSIVFDTIVLGGANNGFDVLVAYIERGILKDVLARLSTLNIDPRVVTSIELHAALEGGADDIARRLVEQSRVHGQDRVDAAREEIASPTINLRTGPFAYTKDLDKTKKKLRVTAVLAVLLALTINSDLLFRTIKARNEASSIRREMRAMYAGLFPHEKRITDELYQLRSHMKEIKDRGDAMIGVYPLRFLLDLSERTMQGITFYEISLDKDLIKMKGDAVGMDSIGKMKTGLSEYLTDVSVSDIKPSAGGRIAFTVVAKGYRQQ